MSHTLTGLSSGEIAPQSGSSIPEKRKHEFDELIHPGDPKTLTPMPWTYPTDSVHGLPYGPVHGPLLRTPPTDHPQKYDIWRACVK